MDTNTIITIISSVGFPIFACIAMGFFVYKTMDKYDARLDALAEEQKNVVIALNNNTKAIEQLVNKL